MEVKKWESPVMNSMLRHKSMYKQTTPPWRETYRKRCSERLKANRQCLLDRFRGISIDTLEFSSENKEAAVQKLMLEEWNNLFGEQELLPCPCSDIDEEGLDEVVTFMESIKTELLQEEEKVITEYQEMLRFEESTLQASICCEERGFVICPLCQKNNLVQVNATISCLCGLKIDTELDNLTLVHLKQQLNQGVELHNCRCCSTVKFSVNSLCGITNLLMTCQNCDFMFIVI